ncbi:hypothetical protein N9B17_00905 [Rhodopirellula sp.]|nr:hypothetical protein [Rhodopirellula sp.]MDA7893853.1 hypothetical protein [bacterium]
MRTGDVYPEICLGGRCSGILLAALVSAFLAVLVSNADPVTQLQLSTWFTLLGAISFLLGSMLLMPEAATGQQKYPPSPNVNQSWHPRCTDGSAGWLLFGRWLRLRTTTFVNQCY